MPGRFSRFSKRTVAAKGIATARKRTSNFKRRAPARRRVAVKRRIYRRRYPRHKGAKLVHVKEGKSIADSRFVVLQYTTTGAYTTTGGAIAFSNVKANSAYNPSGLGTSAGGYQQNYLDYYRNLVRGCQIEVRLWSDSAGDPEPFRIWVGPSTSDSKTAINSYANISSLMNIPHSSTVLYSPGYKLPVIKKFLKPNDILSSQKIVDLKASNQWSALTAADPGQLLYWTIAFQSIAGTTNLNVQYMITTRYFCEFYESIPTPVQQVDERFLDRLGNDIMDEKKEEKKEVLQTPRPIVREEPQDFELVRVPIARSSKK